MGAGGGRAATCGEDALGERVFAVGGLEDDGDGTTTGGVSPRSGPEGEAVDFAVEELDVDGGGAGRS